MYFRSLGLARSSTNQPSISADPQALSGDDALGAELQALFGALDHRAVAPWRMARVTSTSNWAGSEECDLRVSIRRQSSVIPDMLL